MAALILIMFLGAYAAFNAGSIAQAAEAQIQGSALKFVLGDAGNQQGYLLGTDSSELGFFYSPREPRGDAGLFLAATSASNSRISGSLFVPAYARAGLDPDSSIQHYAFVPVSSSSVSGAGTVASPFTQTTTMDAIVPADEPNFGDPALPVFRVVQTATHVNGSLTVKLSYQITNTSGQTVGLSATVGSDLYLDGDDTGFGVISGAAGSRFVGGLNPDTGRTGGLVEQAGSPWSSFTAGRYSVVWSEVASLSAPLSNTVNSDSQVDNGVAVRWSPQSALAAGASITRSVEWRFGTGTPTPPPPPSASAPGAPTGVAAVAGNGQANVSWAAPASDGGAPITSYAVNSSPAGASCQTDGSLSCAVTGLSNGVSYSFTVTATNSAGTSDRSQSSNTVTPLGTPTFASGASLKPVSGTVRIRQPGSSNFIDVADGAEVRDGSEVDVTDGVAQVAFQEAPGSGSRAADVSKGRFVFDQRPFRRSDPLQAESITEFKLSSPLEMKNSRRQLRVMVQAASVCRAPYQTRRIRGRPSCGRWVTSVGRSATMAKSKKKKKSWRPRSGLVTSGSNGYGADEGTEFEVTDSSAFTTFRVFSGSILAVGGTPTKKVTIRAGKAYTFKARAAKKK